MRLIDADNLISVLDILSDKGGDIKYWEQLKLIVADCPTSDVQEVKHGKWESVQYGCVCSVCGKRKEQGSDNFCANCGASMDAEEPLKMPPDDGSTIPVDVWKTNGGDTNDA